MNDRHCVNCGTALSLLEAKRCSECEANMEDRIKSECDIIGQQIAANIHLPTITQLQQRIEELEKERHKAICAFCKKEFAKDDPRIPHHAMTCEASPMVQLIAQLKEINERSVKEKAALELSNGQLREAVKAVEEWWSYGDLDQKTVLICRIALQAQPPKIYEKVVAAMQAILSNNKTPSCGDIHAEPWIADEDAALLRDALTLLGKGPR